MPSDTPEITPKRNRAQLRPSRVLRLPRYYTFASLAVFVVVALFLAWLYRLQAVDELTKLEESKNVTLTKLMASSMWSEFSPLLNLPPRTDMEELRDHPRVTRLRQAIQEQVRDLTVLKVKIYNLDGMTVFSTDPAQIGEDKKDNAGFVSARSGRTATELTSRDHFSAFEREIIDRNVIASYVPLRARDGSGDIVGVFEVYDDVTEFLISIERTERNISIGIAIGLAILYLLLIVVMRQSEKVITTHHDEDQQMLAEIKTVAEMLELRVAERTEALRRSEDQFKQAARTANLGHWTCNETERVYVDISEEYARIHGYTVDEMMSEFVTLDTHRQLIDPEDREGCLAAFESASPDNEFEIEYRIRRRDGVVRHVRRIGQFSTDDERQTTMSSGTLQDITDNKQLEVERLSRARRQRDILVREVHHRIKNNLQGIIGLLHEHQRDNPGLDEAIGKVSGQVGAIALVHGLQANGKDEHVGLKDLVKAIVASIHVPGEVEVASDASIERVVLNQSEAVPIALVINELITNAVKHTTPNGNESVRVNVELQRVDTGASITIRNAQGALPSGFDFEQGTQVGTGLELVKLLLPPESSSFSIRGQGHGVLAELRLDPPVVVAGTAKPVRANSHLIN